MSRQRKNNDRVTFFIDKAVLEAFRAECNLEGVEYSETVNLLMKWFTDKSKKARAENEASSKTLNS